MIRCGNAKRYKAFKAPTCGCEKCKTKWAYTSLVQSIVSRLHVLTPDDKVMDHAEHRLKVGAPDYMIEAVRELAVMHHKKHLKEYIHIMGGGA